MYWHLGQARGLVTGYGSISSTPTRGATPVFPYLPHDYDDHDDLEEAHHMFHEHKYSTPLRSSGFQYLEVDEDEVGTTATVSEAHAMYEIDRLIGY